MPDFPPVDRRHGPGFFQGGPQGNFSQFLTHFDLVLPGKARLIYLDLGVFSEAALDDFKQARVVQLDAKFPPAEKPFCDTLSIASVLVIAPEGMIL